MRAAVVLFSALIAAAASADSVHVISTAPPLREGAVAISPVDQRIVLAAAIGGSGAPNADVHMFRSTDGGQTWSSTGLLPKELAAHAVVGHWDPVLAFDRTGRAFIAVVAAAGFERWSIAIYTSGDEGRTWRGSAISSSSVARNDKPWISIDTTGGPYDGSIHVAWHQLSPTEPGLAYAVSRDGGATFSAPRVFESQGWPWVTAGPDGNIYLSYLGGFGHFDIRRSADGGNTFGAPSRIVSIPTSDPHQVVADASPGPHRNNLYAVIPATDGVYFTRSLDRGSTWTHPIRFSGAAGGMMPSVAVDSSTGEVVLAWLDRENNTRARLFTMSSTDGGATFSPARAVSGSFTASRPVGEYNQLAAENRVHVAVYADETGVFSAARLDASGAPPPLRPRRRAVGR